MDVRAWRWRVWRRGEDLGDPHGPLAYTPLRSLAWVWANREKLWCCHSDLLSVETARDTNGPDHRVGGGTAAAMPRIYRASSVRINVFHREWTARAPDGVAPTLRVSARGKRARQNGGPIRTKDSLAECGVNPAHRHESVVTPFLPGESDWRVLRMAFPAAGSSFRGRAQPTAVARATQNTKGPLRARGAWSSLY